MSLGNWFCTSRKGGTEGGGLAHPESETAWPRMFSPGVACQIFDVLRRREGRLVVTTVLLLIANYPTTLYIPRGNFNV